MQPEQRLQARRAWLRCKANEFKLFSAVRPATQNFQTTGRQLHPLVTAFLLFLTGKQKRQVERLTEGVSKPPRPGDAGSHGDMKKAGPGGPHPHITSSFFVSVRSGISFIPRLCLQVVFTLHRGHLNKSRGSNRSSCRRMNSCSWSSGRRLNCATPFQDFCFWPDSAFSC